MFGNHNNPPPQPPARPRAADVSRIEGTFTQIIVGNDPTDPRVFINGEPVAPGDFDSVTVEIVAPSEANPGTISGIISSYRPSGSDPGGSRQAHTTGLFPGTVDVVAGGRRVVITCSQLNSFDGLWLGVGKRLDGTITEVDGVQALRLAVTATLVDASLTWSDTGATESLLEG